MNEKTLREIQSLSTLSYAIAIVNNLIEKENDTHFDGLKSLALNNIERQKLFKYVEETKLKTNHGFVDDYMVNIMETDKSFKDIQVSLLNALNCSTNYVNELIAEKEKNYEEVDEYPVRVVQTVYVMDLPDGTVDKLKLYDENNKNDFYHSMNAIPGLDITEYYEEDGEKIMFTIEDGYSFDNITKSLEEKINSIKQSFSIEDDIGISFQEIFKLMDKVNEYYDEDFAFKKDMISEINDTLSYWPEIIKHINDTIELSENAYVIDKLYECLYSRNLQDLNNKLQEAHSEIYELENNLKM